MSKLPDTIFTVAEQDSGARLDVGLSRRIDGLSRRLAKQAVAEGRVLVNGKRVAKGHRLTAGDTVVLSWPLPKTTALRELKVLLQTSELLIVDKPAGQPCQPQAPGEAGTLVQQVVEMFPEVAAAGPDPLEGGLLHRLDVNTSGAVALARSQESYERLRQLFTGDSVVKAYLALVNAGEGPVPESGEVRYPLAHAGRGGRMVAMVQGDERHRGQVRSACTHFWTLAQGTGCALLRVHIGRGQMHQIRVHLAALGYPLVGDVLYGDTEKGQGRHALHAWFLAIPGIERCFADLPQDFTSLCQSRGIDCSASLLRSE